MSTYFFEKNKKRKRTEKINTFSGTPKGIRTPDLLVRSQTLYPAELSAHFAVDTISTAYI